MVENYYFRYWIGEYGEENFRKLVKQIISKNEIQSDLEKLSLDNDWQFVYFFAVYLSAALHYFELDSEEIDVILDIAIAPGFHNLFSSEMLLNRHKEDFEDIEKYIDEELNKNSL